MTAYEKLQNCLNNVRKVTDFVPKIALILGSGLGDFAEECVDIKQTIDYKDIEGFPVSTVESHKGRFVFGYIENVPLVVMQGRVHFYEGYPMEDVVLPARLMGLLGAETLFLTNAAGGVNYNFSAGDFMLITDHISSFIPSPLIGKNIDELGLRFPDMSDVYDKEIAKAIKKAASENDIALQEGVYLQFTGPQFESPAEIRMSRTLGADAVGMSTVCEAIAVRHMGLKLCGISCISNLACGMTDNPLTHEEVFETASLVAPMFKKLIKESILEISQIL